MTKKALARNERTAALALHRFLALDHRFRQRLSNCKSDTWSAWVAALNRVILRLADGGDVSPKMRELIVRALSSGELRFVPERPRRGRASIPAARDAWVVGFIRKEIRQHPERQRKAIYADAQKRFGLGRTQVLEIWAKAKGSV